MKFKQLLGIAFKQWDLEHCNYIISIYKEGAIIKMVYDVAVYVKRKKFQEV